MPCDPRDLVADLMAAWQTGDASALAPMVDAACEAGYPHDRELWHLYERHQRPEGRWLSAKDKKVIRRLRRWLDSPYQL